MWKVIFTFILQVLNVKIGVEGNLTICPAGIEFEDLRGR